MPFTPVPVYRLKINPGSCPLSTLVPLLQSSLFSKLNVTPFFPNNGFTVPSAERFRTSIVSLNMGELKTLTPAPRTTHRPPLHGLPYGLLHGVLYRFPLRTTLNNQPNSFYGVEKCKKLTCSSYTIITARKTAANFFSEISRPSLFYFRPTLHRLKGLTSFKLGTH